MVEVRRKSALLKNEGNSARTANLVPAHAKTRIATDHMANDQRFVITEVAVGKPEHEPVADCREQVCRRGRLLWDAPGVQASWAGGEAGGKKGRVSKCAVKRV